MRVRPGSGRGALADPDALTDRERQILGLLVDGVTANRAIAAVLEISENTVKFHLRNILTKLQLADRAQVVGFALRKGLVGR
jgi:DNA-binding NarL/FixJ family response regulator